VAVDIVMPRLSDSMEEGTVLQWFVAEGAAVATGEPLVEVETDKASVTYESEHDGALLRILTGPGESAAVGAVIAVVGDPGEIASDPPARELAAAGAGTGTGTGPTLSAASASRTTPPAAVAAAGSRAPQALPRGRVRASPLARRIAAELGVDLAALVGSGPRGRVIRADVERSLADGSAGHVDAEPARTAQTAGGGARGDIGREPLSRLQQTIVRRMAESRATVPDFELRAEVDMSATVELRGQLRQVSDPAPSINDFLVKAAAIALREFPRVNGAYRDGELERFSRINVGIAVAAPDALLVPVILDADRRSLVEIAAAARKLAARARDGSITPSELAGGTFSVSNLGMFGIDSFSAVINPPQAAILAAGTLKPRPIVDDAGMIVARPTLQLTLACDHRILYGADGARFLTRIRELLERPLALLLS
jgi:pyruvate dehydrogenase E2 component (dihydrolipoyllysine-residue acetyltransferase)